MTYLDRSSNFSVDSRLSFESTFTHNTGARGTNRENSFSTTSSLTDHDAFDFDTNSVSFINTQSTDDVPNLPITAEDRQSYEL
jgi:hypothetical protein